MTVAPQQLYTFRSSYAQLTYSKDDLRKMVTHIESSFMKSDMYVSTLNRLQQRLGSKATGIQLLVNALGREAIRQTIREFISVIATPSPEEDASSAFTIPAIQQKRLSQQHQQSPNLIQKYQKKAQHCASETPPVNPQPLRSQKPFHTSLNTGVSITIPDYPVLADEGVSQPNQVSPVMIPEHSSLANEGVSQPNPVIILDYPVLADEYVDPPNSITRSENLSVLDKLSNISIPETEESPYQAVILPPSGMSENQRSQSLSINKSHPEPSTEREKALSSIGKQLHQARAQQQLSIEQLHQRTCVPSHHIRALEDGVWHHLPEDIYLKGFIRLLGNAVGLNGNSLSKSLSVQTTKISSVPVSLYKTRSSNSDRITKKSSSTNSPVQLQPSHLYLGYAALMAGATGGLAWMVNQSTPIASSIVYDSDSPDSVSIVDRHSSEQGSLKIFAHKIFQQINAIATPETMPPEQIPPSINP